MTLLFLVEGSTRNSTKDASLRRASRFLLTQVGITSPMSRMVVVLGSHEVNKLSIKDPAWSLCALRTIVIGVLKTQLELGWLLCTSAPSQGDLPLLQLLHHEHHLLLLAAGVALIVLLHSGELP